MAVEQIALNATGTVPVQMTTTTDWTQWGLTLILGSLGALYFLAAYGHQIIDYVSAKIALYKIKWRTGRDTIVVRHNKQSLFGSQMIDAETEHKLRDMLLEAGGDPVNLILQTPGGSVFNSQGIIKALQAYKGEVHCYIPRYAMSGGTLIALACDHVYMTESSGLGPVDPQLNSWQIQGSSSGYSHVVDEKGDDAEDVTHMFDYMSDQVEADIRGQVMSLTGNDALTSLLVDGDTHHGRRFGPKELANCGMRVRRVPSSVQTLFKRFVSDKSSNPVLSTIQ